VDLPPLNGTGIHPPPPGTPATAARVGTQGAPIWWLRQPPSRRWIVCSSWTRL